MDNDEALKKSDPDEKRKARAFVLKFFLPSAVLVAVPSLFQTFTSLEYANSPDWLNGLIIISISLGLLGMLFSLSIADMSAIKKVFLIFGIAAVLAAVGVGLDRIGLIIWSFVAGFLGLVWAFMSWGDLMKELQQMGIVGPLVGAILLFGGIAAFAFLLQNFQELSAEASQRSKGTKALGFMFIIAVGLIVSGGKLLFFPGNQGKHKKVEQPRFFTTLISC
jgi:hypothetical protein